MIDGYGNEVTLITEAIRLAPARLAAHTTDYPRPDLSRPGFVGGGCLCKDPYILIRSAEAHSTPVAVPELDERGGQRRHSAGPNHRVAV